MVKKTKPTTSRVPRSPIRPSHGRRERRTAETRERLFRAALDLFARKGFTETTVEDITESAVDEARNTGESMPKFLRSLGVRMTQEPTRHPGIIRTLLQAYLSTTPVRAAMLSLQKRVHALHTEIVRIGQERCEIRKDLPASEIAHVFRQTIFGTLLLWSLNGDASLHARMESAFNVLWSGLSPRNDGVSQPETARVETALTGVPLFTCGD